MAELPEVGAACDICARQDFLPFRCPHCSRTLCSEHKRVHDCAQAPNSVAPAPSSRVPRAVCSFGACSNHPEVRIVCEYCSRNFCLAHRFADQHSCPDVPKKETSESRLAVSPAEQPQPVAIEKSRKLTGAAAARADKIAQMRAKQAAERLGIPASFCHLIYVRPEDTDIWTLLAVHRDWMVGRVTHHAVKTLGLETDRDLLVPVLVPEDSDKPLVASDVISKSCENAASLVLRYVPPRQPPV